MPFLKTKLIESIGLEIDTQRGGIQFFSCYLPGGTQRQEIQAHLSHDISSITLRRQTYFALGDFNVKHRQWNNHRANAAGTILHDLRQRNGFYIIHPLTHTHFPADPQKQPSTIDIGLTNSIMPVNIPVTEPMHSDHNIVQFTVRLDSDVNFEPSHLQYNFKNADWNKFHTVIDESLSGFNFNHSNVQETVQIDNLVDTLTSVIQHAKQVAVPLSVPNKYGLNLTPEIR